jgi:hypothetical protein
MPNVLKYNQYRQPWSNAEHKDRQLIDYHSRIMDTIEILIAHLEPPRVNVKNPISSICKHNEPYHHKTIIDYGTPKKKTANVRYVHSLPSLLFHPRVSNMINR